MDSNKMTSHSQFNITDDDTHTKRTDSYAELSLFVQADHSYSLPVYSSVKEEEFIIEDDLRVVEITEEVDVSMHIGENGSTYLQDVNGIQWNLESPDSFRNDPDIEGLDNLSWKPLKEEFEDSLKTEPQDDYRYIDDVKLVENCVKCKAPLSSGALCVKCNQPWVTLTDIYKTKDVPKPKQVVDSVPDTKQKKFYVLRKSDVEKFVCKNMGKLNVINQYDAANLNANSTNNDGQRSVLKRDVNGRNFIRSNQQNKNNSEKISVTNSNEVVLKKVAIDINDMKRCSGQMKDDGKLKFVRKFVSLNAECFKQNVMVKEEVEEKKDDTEENSMQHTETANKNQCRNTKNVNTHQNIVSANQTTQPKEIAGKDNVESTSSNRSCAKRKSALNHKFFGKNKGTKPDIVEDDNSQKKNIKTDSKKPVVKTKPKLIMKRKLCVACNSTFLKSWELYKHIEEHEPPFGCTKCTVKLLNKTELVSHSVVHNVINTKKLQCRVCEKEVKNLSVLRIHSYVHVKNKEFPCSECNESFITTGQLKLHMVKHGSLPFSCDLCLRQFKRPGYLRRHYCPKRWNLQQKPK